MWSTDGERQSGADSGYEPEGDVPEVDRGVEGAEGGAASDASDGGDWGSPGGDSAAGPEVVLSGPGGSPEEGVGEGEVRSGRGNIANFKGRRGVRSDATGRYGGVALAGHKRDLRALAQALGRGDSDVRKLIRRKLEVISLLYAADSEDGEEFRKNVQLAVDLSGYKQDAAQKAKDKARKTASGKGARERAKMVEREHAPDDGKMRIETF